MRPCFQAPRISPLAIRPSVNYIGCALEHSSDTTRIRDEDETSSSSARTDAQDSGLPRGGDKYRRILDASIDVIAENGFFNARINEIAQRAGVADGTVYLYFKNKDHILRTAIDTGFQQFFERIREAQSHTTNCRERLEIIAVQHLQTLTARRNLAVLMQTEVRQSAKFVSEFSFQHIVDYLNLVREVVREGQAAGELRAELSDRLVAHCFFGALDEIVNAWVFSGRVFEPTSTAAQIVDILFTGIHKE
jgi:TetR/AcrR family transcriptional regulator, fatty acid metabolism regulator protein